MEIVVSGWGRDHGEKIIANRDLTQARSSAFGGYERPEVYLTTSEARESGRLGVQVIENGHVELQFYAKITLNGEYLVRQTMSCKEVAALFLSLYDDCSLRDLLTVLEEVNTVSLSRKIPPVMLKEVIDVGFAEWAVDWLRQNDIWRVGDLVRKTESYLRALPGYDDRLFVEISKRLTPLGLKLGMEVPNLPDVPSVLLQRVDDLELSIRTANCLKNDNIEYVGQLVQKTEMELLRVPNFGRKSVNEIKELLARMKLRLGTELPNWKQP